MASRSVNGKIDGGLQAGDAIGFLTPVGEAFSPGFSLICCELICGKTLIQSILGVYPGSEIFRTKIRKVQQQVWQISFGVDGNNGNIVDQGLFQNADSQSGFSAAGHADDDRMSIKVFGVIEDQIFFKRSGSQVIFLAEIKGAELLVVIFH